MGNHLFNCLCCRGQSFENRNDSVSQRIFTQSTPLSMMYSEPNTPQPDKPFVHSLSKLPIKTSTYIRKVSGLPWDHYEVIRKIGQGAYGSVMQVAHKQTGCIRAMKIISKDNLIPGFSEEDIEREIRILKNMDHPNIIKIYEIFRDNLNFYLVTEYCSEGDLCEKLDHMRFMDERIVKVLMCQILTAVSYLHSKNVFHGDLKLENVMIDSRLPNHLTTYRKWSFRTSITMDLENIKNTYSTVTNKSSSEEQEPGELYNNFPNFKNFEIKLIDFGCSKMFNKYRRQFKDSIGTLYYLAPEVIKTSYNEKCDLWSCGVIMYMLLSGDIPFYGHTEKEITSKILSGKFTFKHSRFLTVSESAKDLIQKLLTYDPSSRISVQEALKHDFFTTDIDPHNLFRDKLESERVLSNLTKYQGKNSKFYQAVLTFITHNFAQKDEITTLNKIFLHMDKNLDGKISKEELIESYKEIGMNLTNDAIDRVIQIIDNDNNGFIEYEEFLRATIPKKSLLTDINLKSAFDLFDIDKSGGISCNEVKEVLGLDENVGDNVIADLLCEINKSEKDDISFSEFKSIMTTLAKNNESENENENEATNKDGMPVDS